MAGLPPEGLYVAIGLLAALENIVPPVPADTAVALGAFLAARGVPVSPVALYAVTVLSNTLTAVAVFAAARRYGRAFFRESRLGRWLISARAMSRIERAYARHHWWGIFASRFLPVYRAVVPPFAGIAGLTPGRALPPVLIATGLYYGVLMLVVYQLGTNWDEVARILGRVGLVLLAAAAAATMLLVRRWRRRERED